ncbi:uncharacterized protein LOC129608093 [Condylostylus longicornis]|uniref:uncharacterized protein LOC129608093 n=1 Tax=Condylostylus longicornis TaxID=2530218 RepID=UPI00244E3889|nr:uncharacterized protein LOC129608093 [Condylostylus longicornis]
MEPQTWPRIHDRSTRQRSRQCIKDSDLNIGSWNIRTMLLPGKMAEVVDEIMNYNFEIVALQELRWKGQGELRKRDYSIFYSGNTKPGLNGTGFYVSKKIRNSVLYFEPINDRVCVLKLRGKFQNITLLSVYSPTETTEDELKEAFYDDIFRVCNKISRHDLIIIMGDFNAKIGKENFIKNVAGLQSLHSKTSENGTRLVNFASENNLWISSVSFQHKRIHKQTWKIPGERGANQIDHVLVDKRHATSILDVKTCRGANCDSDHYMIKIKIRQRLSTINSNKNIFKRIKWDTEKIVANEDLKLVYQQNLSHRIDNVYINNNPSQNWANICEAIKDAAKEVIGSEPRNNNNWYDSECKRINEVKNEAWKKQLSCNTRSNRMPLLQTVENTINQPTMEETQIAIEKLKNGKASGEDSIIAELIKYGGNNLHYKIHDLIISIWNTEIIPESWLNSIIFPVHKKGDKKICSNYRGISLLNVSYKIFTNILYDRINEIAEKVIGEYQCGFRRGKSTIDQCFALSQIFEKSQERLTESIGKKVFGVMQRLGVPEKLIRLACATLRNTKAKVLVQGKLTNSFNIDSGVKQGDALSALIFNMMLHYAINEIDPGATIFIKSYQICAYADDIVILSRNANVLKEIFTKLAEATAGVGLHINEKKTKYFIKSRTPRITHNLSIGTYTFESVTQFKYLGVVFSNSEDSSIAIKERISAANKSYFAHAKLLKSKLLTRSTKFKLYKTLIRPILTYGCEVWNLKVADCKMLSIFERKILRRLYGPVRMNGNIYRARYNHELEALIRNRTIIRFIKSKRISWLGHMVRMSGETTLKRIFMHREQGTRARGRPKSRWLDMVEADLSTMNIRNYSTLAQDRSEWKRIAEEALAHRGL